MNLIYHSADLKVEPTAESPGWSHFDCVDGADGEPLPNCISVESSGGVEPGPGVEGDADFGVPVPYLVTFAPPHPQCPGPECPCEGRATCGWAPESAYGQEIQLREGLHRVSWYAKPSSTGGGLTDTPIDFEARQVLRVTGMESGSVWAVADPSSKEAENGWRRYWFLFDVPAAEAARVLLQSGTETPGSAVWVAGPMLELVQERAGSLSPEAEPRPFSETGVELEHPLRVCEDTDGTVFRAEGWRRNCVRLCDDGFGSSCAPETSIPFCYHETEFTISQRAIDRGEIFGPSGFARGNFNYRLDTIALNFVGTAARQCDDPELPSTCHSAGFIPYTLEHLGPYTVRNTLGDDYQAPLFTGFIEHARGLAAERYLSNPISSADRTLIEPYLQRQFRGRPLTGTYRLRVWQEPGVNFDGIEDVQVVLNYQFWTRFE